VEPAKRDLAVAKTDVDSIFDPDRITTAHLCDVAPFGVVMDAKVRSVWRGARVSGPAFTVKVAPGDNASLHASLGVAKAGDVLVVEGSGFLERALWGAIMTFAAIRRGIAGLVVDGAVRDVEEIERLGFAVFAAGQTPVGPYNKVRGALGAQIVCGGLAVSPGDLVYADDDGVVVVPTADANAIVAAARDRADREEKIVRGLTEGAQLAELLPLLRMGQV
jgi:4-hydroxy-4-methyl-2-oxoglutarate aldolase